MTPPTAHELDIFSFFRALSDSSFGTCILLMFNMAQDQELKRTLNVDYAKKDFTMEAPQMRTDLPCICLYDQPRKERPQPQSTLGF